MDEWTRDRNCVTMDDTPHIQKLKQKIAEKKAGIDRTQQEEEPESEQIDFEKFMRQ